MHIKLGSGGFVFIEFAIALPLLIMLFYCLGLVTIEIFKLGKAQLADYVLEEEAQYVMERITHEVRVAKEINPKKITNDIYQIQIVYHAIDNSENFPETRDEANKKFWYFSNKDVLETQFFIPRNEKGIYKTLNAKRQESGSLSNPITGGNSFGDTKITCLKYDLDEDKKILHIALEMESLVTEHKIKIVTAIFMPSLS